VTGIEQWPDLASRALGGTVMWANDELFAGAENLITPGPAQHDRRAYGPRGKVYDGWETRRRRAPGEDSAIVRLGVAGIVREVVVDTAHFTGNFPPFASLDGTCVLGYPGVGELRAATWSPLVAKSALAGDTRNTFTVAGADRLITHVRLNIHPDGGVARLRVHGEVVPDPRLLGARVDLAATVHGGRIIDCSNMFYGSPSNVLAPGRAAVMSDGWETSRRRDAGNDWLVVALAAPGQLHDAVVDTSRFVGNAPGWAALSDAGTGGELLTHTPLLPDTEHRFRLRGIAAVDRVRLDIYPDGGLSRLRLHGSVSDGARPSIAQRWLSLLPADQHVATDEFFD
jgi:allantoicase